MRCILLRNRKYFKKELTKDLKRNFTYISANAFLKRQWGAKQRTSRQLKNQNNSKYKWDESQVKNKCILKHRNLA